MDKLECVKSTDIGQSAAKLRTGERSSTISQESSPVITGRNGGYSFGSIYVLKDCKGNIRYVGQTYRTLEERLIGHKSDARRKNNHVQYWLRTLQCEPTIHLVKIYKSSLLDKAEVYWYNYYRAMGYKLTNARTPNPQRKMGFKHTEAAKLKIAIAGRNQQISDVHKAILVQLYSKPIQQLSLTGEYIATYPSAKEAERVTGICAVNIRHVVNGNRTKAGRYKWVKI